LADHPTLNGTTATAEVTLAELVIDKGDSASMAEALALLNSFLERRTSQFPSVLFRWHLALIAIAQVTREKETVRRAAKTALDLAGRGPVFPGHTGVSRNCSREWREHGLTLSPLGRTACAPAPDPG